MKQHIDLLKSFTIFKDLNDDEIQSILSFSHIRKFKKNDHIFMQGDVISHVYFMISGQVKIYRTGYSGNEQIVNFLKRGNMFPHQGFFRKDNYPAHAQASGDVELICIPIMEFESFLYQRPEICIRLLSVLGDLIVDLQNRLESKMVDTAYEQVIKAILRIGEANGKKEGDYTVLTVKITNQELANIIGSSRETVSRSLTKLKKNNLLHMNKNGFLYYEFDVLHEQILY
ncbi:Crp/Fnr family transcriptional regulator [Alkalibacillus aidingensis]|uniref:Crp/Fnr family transcriptional regulator n=1 Tax=Alkalibacillus aidingensis TaxID=2747607 RepID=UPI001CB72394|nr:Crp/Fnr family transcriptional regulator [Alkalibacillus aidingensis]